MPNEEQARRHPDVFTPEEALTYLGVAGATERTLETLRKEHGLRSFSIGHQTLYHRASLDAVLSRLSGIEPTETPRLKIAGGRR